MDNKITALIVIVIVLLVAGVVAFNFTGTKNNTNNSTVTNTSQNQSNSSVVVKVVANQTGPLNAKKGDNVTINYTVSNQGSGSVFNMKISDQNFDNSIGTLNEGQTKNFSYVLHIPTDEDVQQDFGANATVSNPLFIGGFAVSFTDSKGSTHTINANSIEIKLD
jgi:cytoskeletal protein RodZ